MSYSSNSGGLLGMSQEQARIFLVVCIIILIVIGIIIWIICIRLAEKRIKAEVDIIRNEFLRKIENLSSEEQTMAKINHLKENRKGIFVFKDIIDDRGMSISARNIVKQRFFTELTRDLFDDCKKMLISITDILKLPYTDSKEAEDALSNLKPYLYAASSEVNMDSDYVPFLQEPNLIIDPLAKYVSHIRDKVTGLSEKSALEAFMPMSIEYSKSSVILWSQCCSGYLQHETPKAFGFIYLVYFLISDLAGKFCQALVLIESSKTEPKEVDKIDIET